jgi:hypothetical protein
VRCRKEAHAVVSTASRLANPAPCCRAVKRLACRSNDARACKH